MAHYWFDSSLVWVPVWLCFLFFFCFGCWCRWIESGAVNFSFCLLVVVCVFWEIASNVVPTTRSSPPVELNFSPKLPLFTVLVFDYCGRISTNPLDYWCSTRAVQFVAVFEENRGKINKIEKLFKRALNCLRINFFVLFCLCVRARVCREEKTAARSKLDYYFINAFRSEIFRSFLCLTWPKYGVIKRCKECSFDLCAHRFCDCSKCAVCLNWNNLMIRERERENEKNQHLDVMRLRVCVVEINQHVSSTKTWRKYF